MQDDYRRYLDTQNPHCSDAQRIAFLREVEKWPKDRREELKLRIAAVEKEKARVNGARRHMAQAMSRRDYAAEDLARAQEKRAHLALRHLAE